MLPSRGLRWAGSGISNGRQRLLVRGQGARAFSINTTTSSILNITRRSPAVRHSSFQQCRSLSLFGWGSTTKSTPDPSSTQSSTADVDIGPASGVLDNVRTVKADHGTSISPDLAQAHLHPPNSIEPKIIEDLQEQITLPHGSASHEITSIVSGETDITAATERIGYLKEVCGLDFGWGPSSIMEYLLEWLHVSAGLSWTAAIVAVATILRVAMIKPIIDSQIQGKKMREMQPFIKPLREKYTALLRAGDRQKAMEVGAEMKEINKSAGISYAKAFIPLLIQLPFSFGAFRVLRNAGQLHVPAFVTEDWLWTTDLSFSDPYFITPAISAATIYFSFKLQQQSNNALLGPQVIKILSVAMPIASFGFMSFQPGSVQLYFMTTGLFAFGTTALLRQQWFRDWADLGPLPTGTLSPTPMTGASPSTAQPQIQQTPLPAGIKRIEIPVTNQQPAVNVASDDTKAEDRSVIDRAVDNVKGKWSNMTKNTTGEGVFSKTVAEKQQQRKEASVARLNAIRQREIDQDREVRNRQARDQRS